MIKNEKKSLILIIKVVRDNILNFCAFFGFGVKLCLSGAKMVRVKWKWWKLILCLLERTRKYTKVLEWTRNVHKYVISSFRLCFLLIFCKSGAGVEWKWSEFVSSWFTRTNYNLLEKTLKDSKGAQIWYEVKIINEGCQFVSRVKINWVLIWSENFHHS